MRFNTINIYCIFIPGINDKSKDFDTLYSFNLAELPGYMIILHRQNFYIKI